MKTRRYRNRDGRVQIRRGRTEQDAARISRRLKIRQWQEEISAIRKEEPCR